MCCDSKIQGKVPDVFLLEVNGIFVFVYGKLRERESQATLKWEGIDPETGSVFSQGINCLNFLGEPAWTQVIL